MTTIIHSFRRQPPPQSIFVVRLASSTNNSNHRFVTTGPICTVVSTGSSTCSLATANNNNNNNNKLGRISSTTTTRAHLLIHHHHQQQQHYRTYTSSSLYWNMSNSSNNNNDNNNNNTTSSSSSDSYTGSVKFYLRDKGYGFIEIDPPMMGTGGSRKNYYQPTDLFVHRNAILTTIPIDPIPLYNKESESSKNTSKNSNPTPPPTAETSEEEEEVVKTGTDNTIEDDMKSISIRYPYLKKGERVRFRIHTERNGLRRASDVTFLNGLAIPPLRKNYLGGIYERAHLILGEQIYSILNDYYNKNKGDKKDTNKTANVIHDTEIVQQIHEAYEEAESKIQNAISIVTSLGMKVSDFPITREKDGKGRYSYDNTNRSNDE